MSNAQNLKSLFPSPLNSDYLISADKIINDNVYQIPPYGEFEFENRIAWEKPYNNKSLLRMFHGHFFINDLTAAYKKTKNTKYIIKGFEIIEDWIKNHPFAYSSGTMTWHDEVTARRLMVWMAFFDEACKVLSDDQLALLRENLAVHARLLCRDDFYSKNSNHGMFQDQALIVYSSYFDEMEDSEEINRLACSRLKQYYDFIFSKEAVHLEHSPVYHELTAVNLMVYGKYLSSINNPLGDYLLELYNKASVYASYIIKPDAYFPQIGDTPKIKAKKMLWQDNPQYQYAVSKGKEGIAPSATDMVFPDAGYAIFRDSWAKKEQATYILFTAAYHPTYHKHSDDLSLWLYSNGDIITEAGAYSYDYADSYCKYAYSSFAHNTLIVDNNGLDRADGKYSSCRLTDYKLDQDSAVVSGINERFEGVKHTRTIEYVKSKRIINVTDDIQSEKTHDYKLFWHLARDISPVIEDDKVKLFRHDNLIAELSVRSSANHTLMHIKGQTDPYFSGWYFEKFHKKEANSVLLISFEGCNNVIRSEFRLQGN